MYTYYYCVEYLIIKMTLCVNIQEKCLLFSAITPYFYTFFQLLQGLSVASVSVLVAWCLGIKNRILKWIPNIYLAPIMIRLLDYPLELLPLGLKSATSISLLFTGIYLLYMTPTYIGMCFIVKTISRKIS